MPKGKNVPAHEQVHTIIEYIEYPTHPHRSDSPEYKKNHDILIDEDKRPCFVCDRLGMKQLPTEHLETHHFVIEWAEWENADPIELQKLFDDGVIDFYGYSKKLKGEPVRSPDDIRNLLVLCPLHHRGKGTGVHETSIPMWFSQIVSKNGVEMLKGAIKNHK
jgi:hypothetical protein